mgnify:CR=1 FL=1
MSKNNDVVIIELDRPRELRYGHKALKKMTAITGVSLDDMDTDKLDLEQIEKIIYCGLLSDARANNETLKLEDMEDLLDQAPHYGHVMEKMQEGFEKAFGSSFEGNDQPGKSPANQNPSTGKKA